MKSMNMNKSAGMYAAPSADCTLAGPTQVQTGLLGGGFGQQSGGFALQRAGLGQQGSANNDCLVLTTLADGSLSLTAESAAGLIYMIEEEKMARDLYDAFAEQTGSVVFDRISNSEQKHFDSLLLVAQKAGIDVSAVTSNAAGIFTNASIQSMYNDLFAQGSISLDAAYEVGVLVEQADIADLQQYSADASIGIVGTVYAHLEAGSEHHLAAFSQYAALV